MFLEYFIHKDLYTFVLLCFRTMAESNNQSSRAPDFQEEVDGYLKRGQVYTPANKFIQKLSLCPRYIGGDNSHGLLPAILQMVDLVKRRLRSARNKKTWSGWLKEAAKTLEVYQVADREWISTNVGALPARAAPKVQSYDPLAGKHDIRYFPSASGELEMELEGPPEDVLENRNRNRRLYYCPHLSERVRPCPRPLL